MNVLIINPILATPDASGNLPRLGSIKDTMIYGMALGFLAAGHTPTLVAAADFRPTTPEIYDFPVIFLPTSIQRFCPPGLLPYMPGLSSWLRRHSGSFDIVIAKECFSLATLSAARVCPRKTLVWQELAAHQRRFRRIPSRLWHNVIARLFMRSLRAVGCSPAARDFLSNYLPLTAPGFIEHGIDDSKFHPCDPALKQRRLITSSQLIPRKNVASILRKFAAFHKMSGYEDVTLTIAGDGIERPALEKLAARLGIAGSVSFVGFLPRHILGRLVAGSLAFLVDTKADLNVISIVEAVAAGIPVVTNRIPLTAPWIDSEGLGIAKDGWDASDLASIVDNASDYASRCRAVAPSLSSAAVADALVKLADV